MTRLMQELLADPGCSFEVDADLPSGNRMFGTVGPLIGGRVSASLIFETNPPTPEDIEIAKRGLAQAVGTTEVFADVSTDHEASMAKMRKFMGGGQG